MKALILAAGYATRLYPLTENQPKPLLKVGGKPIIEHLLERIWNLPEIDEVFIVTNARFYDNFVAWLKSFSYPKKIVLLSDRTQSKDDRLGAVGDINFIIGQKDIVDDLLILGGDNLFEDDLSPAKDFFLKSAGSVILLNDVKDKELAKKYGIAELDQNRKIVQFLEKPNDPPSTLSSTLIYFLKQKHLRHIPEALRTGFADRTGDFICYLSKKEDVYGLSLSGKWFDIGSFESLNEADRFLLTKVEK